MRTVMRGRLGDARAAINARVEKLREIPNLHAREHQAIEDARSRRIWSSGWILSESNVPNVERSSSPSGRCRPNLCWSECPFRLS